MSTHHSILIVGGGTGGITVAARLANEGVRDIALIEPSETHYYQPLWTLVGGGVFPKEVTARRTADFVPDGVTWIRDAAESFDPEKNTVKTQGGETLTYDYLVVAMGLKLDWHEVKGLEGHVGKDGICSNYSYQTVDSTWRFIRDFKGGDALFTFPKGPIKCGGAPQKIMWLAEHYFERQGIRDRCRISFCTHGASIFGVEKYRRALEKLVEARGIEMRTAHTLVEVRPSAREAVFHKHDTDEEVVLHYDLIHVTPPQSPPEVLKRSPLVNDDGYVEVDKYSLQHLRYPNVFSLGDCSSLPTSKTGAAVRKEAPVLVENLLAHREGRALTARYNGYTSCPLVTGYGRLILAEFDYDGNPVESFPFDQAQERYSMYALKAYALPEMYWHGMLRGRM